METTPLLITFVATSGLFAVLGLVYALRHGPTDDLDAYVTARGSVGSGLAALTLFASGMGAWILFSPAEVGARYGIPGILGYAVGSALPMLIYTVVGVRMRRHLPMGQTLTEFVWHRYGRSMFGLTLLVSLFYMFIFLTAEVTGLALLMRMLTGVPLWTTAALALAATLAYTTLGGLRASIFTDGVQALIILPLLAALTGATLYGLGDVSSAVRAAGDVDPALLSWNHGPGWQEALTLVVAIAAASLFNQGNWQRVYAVRDVATLRRGFPLAAALILPVVFVLGLFGLLAVGRGQAEPPSIALFQLIQHVLPDWAAVGLVVVGIALVMSSADTLLNAIAGLIALDARRVLPKTSPENLLKTARWTTLLLAVPVLVIASQGYSVLYLFLIADLVCAAAVFPVFYGLFARRHGGRAALWSVVAGLVAGGLLFPDPAFGRGHLLGSFLAALGVSIFVSLLWPCTDTGSHDPG